jgi:hypothetical protein
LGTSETSIADNSINIDDLMVRKEGFEPPRPFGHKILSLARLPVPPLPQWWLHSTRWQSDAAMGFGKMNPAWRRLGLAENGLSS